MSSHPLCPTTEQPAAAAASLDGSPADQPVAAAAEKSADAGARKPAAAAAEKFADQPAAQPAAPRPAAKPSRKRAHTVDGASSAGTSSADTATATFSIMAIIAACQDGDFDTLEKLAAAARAKISSMRIPEKGWRAHLPVWVKKAKVPICHLCMSFRCVIRICHENMLCVYVITICH